MVNHILSKSEYSTLFNFFNGCDKLLSQAAELSVLAPVNGMVGDSSLPVSPACGGLCFLSLHDRNSYFQKEIVNLISQKENAPFENLVRVVQGGKNRGNWLHKKLALPFSRWLSVEFASGLIYSYRM
jgi:hypothetical protein